MRSRRDKSWLSGIRTSTHTHTHTHRTRFWSHGSPDLIAPPLPPLTNNVTENPYDDPANPPADPEAATDVCGMRWARGGSSAAHPVSGLRRYELRNFSSAAEATGQGFSVTHTGHCGACSSLQVARRNRHHSFLSAGVTSCHFVRSRTLART